MNIQPNRIYHLKINSNFYFEVLILVTQVWTQIWQSETPKPDCVTSDSATVNFTSDSATVNFKLLASTIDVGEWTVMNVPLFNRSFPVEIAPKDLPLFLTWSVRTPAFEDVLKGV